MSVKKLRDRILLKNNFLCVGLDPDLTKIPSHLPKSAAGVISFNNAIIEATKAHCVAYKINFAFYEALGKDGWMALEKTRKLLPESHFLIADAKRGDIGNTARKYAESVFGDLDFDAVTLNPYMGQDVVEPFLAFENKSVILLALTSNAGSHDFQLSKLSDGRFVFEEVIEKSSKWASPENLMYVVGATKPTYFKNVRRYAENHFLLVPGVGAQGGSLNEVYEHGRNAQIGLLINSSRGIIYADQSTNFADGAQKACARLQAEMEALMKSS